MRALSYSLLALALVGPLVSPTLAEEATAPDPLGMWECPQDGAVPLYTNREQAGCRKMELKPLSVVPPLPDFPTRLQRTHPSAMEQTPIPQIEPVPPRKVATCLIGESDGTRQIHLTPPCKARSARCTPNGCNSINGPEVASSLGTIQLTDRILHVGTFGPAHRSKTMPVTIRWPICSVADSSRSGACRSPRR